MLPILPSERFDVIVIGMLDTPDEEMRLLASADIPIARVDDGGLAFIRNSLIKILMGGGPPPICYACLECLGFLEPGCKRIADILIEGAGRPVQ